MNWIVVLGIAVGLAMDTVAISISCGATLKKPLMFQSFRIAGSFGLFQAVMPVVGWLSGLSFRKWIEGFDHWIALGLLVFIGCRMIVESIRFTEKRMCLAKPGVLFMMSLATSIDALAVGLSFSLLKTGILGPAILIGAVTFILSWMSIWAGKKIGSWLGKKVEVAGGIILIGIGIKILLEHLGIHF